MKNSFDYISLRYKDFIDSSLNYLILKAMEYMSSQPEFERFIIDRGKVFFVDTDGNECFKFYTWIEYSDDIIKKFPDFYKFIKIWGNTLLLDTHYICATKSEIEQYSLYEEGNRYV